MAKQAVAHANQRLIFPCITAHRALAYFGFAVDQHSSAPFFYIEPCSRKPSKRRRNDENQYRQGDNKTCRCCPITAVNQVNKRKNGKSFDRGGKRNQDASSNFAVRAQRGK